MSCICIVHEQRSLRRKCRKIAIRSNVSVRTLKDKNSALRNFRIYTYTRSNNYYGGTSELRDIDISIRIRDRGLLCERVRPELFLRYLSDAISRLTANVHLLLTVWAHPTVHRAPSLFNHDKSIRKYCDCPLTSYRPQ